MTDTPGSPTHVFIDYPHAPDLFADAARGLFHLNGNIRISLVSVRASHDASKASHNQVVVGRIVTPIKAAKQMAKGLLKFIEAHESAASPTAEGTATLQ